MHTQECSRTSFLVSAVLHLSQVNTVIVLAFLEYLYNNCSSPANISNYITGIRAMYIVNGLHTQAFREERLPLFIKSLTINAPLTPKVKNCHICRSTTKYFDSLQKITKLTHFSNSVPACFFSHSILPHSAKQFDPTRHLTIGGKQTMRVKKLNKHINYKYLGCTSICKQPVL